MRCLIRFHSRLASGAIQVRDRVFDGDALTLGRATDQVLHLKDRRVALEHARLVRRERGLVVQALAPAGVDVNGVVLREARLGPGDELRIGANILRIIEPPVSDGEAVDFAFTFELDPEARSEDIVAPAAPRRLSEIGLGMRAWSWFAFLLVLAVALLVPGSGLFDDEWRDQLRETAWLPDDRLWLSGPLADVHQVVNTQCEACHQQPFVQVRDDACLACHAVNLRQHAPGAGDALLRIRRNECTDCHREHDGSEWLVRQDDVLCAGCHADLPAVAGSQVAHRPASDFWREHPPFRVSVTAWTGEIDTRGRALTEVRRGLPDSEVTDPSGLFFPHDVHLDPAGLVLPDGRQWLDCGDCHRLEPGGARFAPVRMQQHCAACHQLDFDPASPARQVPHGPVADVVTHLLEFYARRYLEEFADPLATARPAAGQRRPGAPPTAAERAAALERARERVDAVARDLVERRACANCHEVEVFPEAPLEQRWQVRPVVITEAWMPGARFSHRAHGTTLTPCSTCHAAEVSSESADILMPDIAACRDCHAGSSPPRGVPNLLPSGCATCHAFHHESAPLWQGGHELLLRYPGDRPVHPPLARTATELLQ